MNCYKHIEIENWKDISEKIFYFVKNTDILKKRHSWNTVKPSIMLEAVPELQNVFERYNLVVKTTAIIYRPPRYQGGIHIDSGKGIRVLLPIRNCEGSYTKFFKVDESKIEIKHGGEGDQYYHIPSDAVLKEIGSVETVKPFVFNPQIPHGVYANRNLEPRLTFTIGFDRSPTELLY